MTTDNNSVTSTPELEIPAHQPAPGAEEQKPTPATPEETVEAQQETTEQKEAKEKSKFQRRLERQKTARIAAETETKLLRERLEKLEAQSKPQQESAEPQRNGINPKTGAEYTFEEYLEARADWRADRRVDDRLKTEREAQQGKDKQQQAAAGSEKLAKAWAERETSFQTATKDYEAIVAPFADEELQHLSHQARMAIVESDVGPALLYHLAKNPDVADQIADLSPLRQVAELGKLEAKVSMPAKKITNAPAPANTTTGGKTATKDLSKMSQEEYEAHRKSQGARWAR